MKNYIIFLTIAGIAMGSYAYASSRPNKVTLTSDKWECVTALPKGLDTICVNYRVKG